MKLNSYCVILAGGIGRRFWPVSNQQYPKQFTDLFHTGKSLIRQTYERVSQIFEDDKIFVITNADYEKITREQIPELPNGNILKEPVRRNTATCIMYAACKIKKISPDSSMLVIPSDHFITNDNIYLENIKAGFEYVDNHGGLLTFGIKPTRVETEYGYIQEKKQKITENVSAVKTFTEKPNLELAQTFYESGDFLWNAGMFIWKTEEIIYQIKKHIYDLYNLFESDSLINTPQEQEFIDTIYGQCPNISIDVGVLEKSRHVYVFKGSFGWSDVGSWHAFKAISEKDENNNITNSPHIILKNTKNCIVNVPEDKEVVIYGAENLIIAEKGKYLMICNAEDEEQIKFFDKIVKYHKSETPF